MTTILSTGRGRAMNKPVRLVRIASPPLFTAPRPEVGVLGGSRKKGGDKGELTFHVIL